MTAYALTGFFSFPPGLLRLEPSGLFSFGRLVPGLLVYATRLALFLWGSLGRWRLSGLFLPGFRLPDLPGFFLVFRPGYLEAVLESSFFRKGMGANCWTAAAITWAARPAAARWCASMVSARSSSMRSRSRASASSWTAAAGGLPPCSRCQKTDRMRRLPDTPTDFGGHGQRVGLPPVWNSRHLDARGKAGVFGYLKAAARAVCPARLNGLINAPIRPFSR